ncbi:nitrous oxide reductase accessory protein NosL [Paenibacillus sp. FSL W8-1187]|uniref:nitrous oxide reductase accessory protein NosL n=1 Tax=Paenibacillus sp. FSL W8-1187 TaxID=2975339 RepID=UPI0030DBFA59
MTTKRCLSRTLPLAALLTLLLLLAACGSKDYGPVPIDESVDKCAICNMTVKDDAFATQLTTTEGKTFKFDDIGCMNDWKAKNAAAKIGGEYVRDYNDKEWIAYADAYYVYDKDLKTPMAYGVVSFKDKASAEAFAQEQGKGQLLTAAELASHSWEQNKDMMMGEGHSHDGDAGESHGDGMDMSENAGHEGGMDMSENASNAGSGH